MRVRKLRRVCKFEDRQIEKEGGLFEDIQDFDFEKFFEVILKILRSQKVVDLGSTFDCWSRGEFTG